MQKSILKNALTDWRTRQLRYGASQRFHGGPGLAEVVNVSEGESSMAKSESKELEKKTQESTAMGRPAFIDPTDKTGTEDIGRDDLRLPRLVIAQGLSTQLIEGDSNYIKDLKMFDLFNDLTGEIYGRGPIRFIPCRRDVVRIEFDPEDGTKVLDRNVPANNQRLEWDGDQPPKATRFTEFVALLIHEAPRKPEPIVISIKETNKFMRRAAERLTGFVKFQDGPIYAGYKTVVSKSEKNDSGTFGVFVFDNAGFIQEEPMYRFAEQFSKGLGSKQVVTNRNNDPDAFDAEKLEHGGPNGSEM